MQSNTVLLAAADAPRVHVLEILGNAIVGGMETSVLRLVQRLPRDRFRFSALLPYEGELADQLRAFDVEVHIATISDDPSWRAIQTAAALVESTAVDVLHAHLTPAHVLGGLVGRLTRRPVLATIHGRELPPIDYEVHRAAATNLHVVCRHSLLHALGLGVETSRMRCIPNGVDTEVFKPVSSCDNSALRAELGISRQAPCVGFVGRLSPEKGPEVFIRAAQKLHRSLPQTRFIVVGEGPLRPSLQALVHESGLDGVLILAGLRADMPAVYNALNVAVSTSYSEAMPLAVMEAMASGLPVVATRVGGVPEIVDHGGSGWLVAAGDHRAIAERVAQLLQSPADGARFGARARLRAVQRLNIADSVQGLQQWLLELAPVRVQEPRTLSAVGNSDALRRGGAATSRTLSKPSGAVTPAA